MAWVKIDDQFPDHPKVMAAGPLASWLYVCGLAYCARFLTDGFISRAQVRKMADVDNPLELAEALIRAGLWHRDEERDGFCVHDYLEYNPDAEQVRASRQAVSEKRREAGSKGAASRWHGAGRDGGKTDDAANDNAMANGWQSRGKGHGKNVPPSPSPSLEEDNPRRATHDTPSGGAARDAMEGFDEFWDAYPSKEAKSEARRAWQKLHPGPELRQTILCAIGRAKEGSEKWQRGVIPHPANWLTGKRWNDEFAPPVTTLTVRGRASPPLRPGQSANAAVADKFLNHLRSVGVRE